MRPVQPRFEEAADVLLRELETYQPSLRAVYVAQALRHLADLGYAMATADHRDSRVEQDPFGVASQRLNPAQPYRDP